MKLSPLAFQIYRHLVAAQVWEKLGQKWLVSCSGGLDSVVLVAIARELAREAEAEIAIVHIHHGESSELKQNQARTAMLEHCQKISNEGQLKFYTSEIAAAEVQAFTQSGKSSSEDKLRSARLVHISRHYKGFGASSLWLGHHRQDQLETRILNLIRGTGRHGLEAMPVLKVFDQYGIKAVRPLLQIDQGALREYAVKKKLKWIDDPSNQNSAYLRNWVRSEWLPMLEARRRGSQEALARSLDIIADELAEQKSGREILDCIKAKGIDRRRFEVLSASTKAQVLRHYLESACLTSGTKTQIDEVIKRLDSQQKELIFCVGKVVWRTSKDFIFVEAKRENK